MRKHYEFSNGVRGKHARQARGLVRTVVLDPDVAKFFQDSKSVNHALRALAEIARRATRPRSR